MIRSSIRKSFLDDLLGDNDVPLSKPIPTTSSPSSDARQQQQQRTKSVRFVEGDDSDDILGSLLPASSTSSTVLGSRVSHDSISGQGSKVIPGVAASSSEGPRKQEQATASKSAGTSSSSDWLGLSQERSYRETDDHRIRERGRGGDQRGEDTEFGIMPSVMKRRESLEDQNTTPSWLNQQQKAAVSGQPASSSSSLAKLPGAPVDEGSMGSSSSLSNFKILPERKSRIDEQQQQEQHHDRQEQDALGFHAAAGDPYRRLSISSNATASTLPLPQSSKPRSSTASLSSVESSLLLLQTQVKVLEVEKAHLSQMLDQCRLLHTQELQMMTEMHTKQLEMTKSFLSSQEKMSIEERDRRIYYLKQESDCLAGERSKEREGYCLKLDQLIQERDEEISRIKERHAKVLDRLQEDHEKEEQRWQRIRAQEESEVKALLKVYEPLRDLVKQWKASAEEMNRLQDYVTSKQEKMMNESVIEIQNREMSVSNAITKLDSFSGLREQLSRLAEEHKDLIVREKRELAQERRDWERDRQKAQEDLSDERQQMMQQRESLDQQSAKLQQQKLQQRQEKELLAQERQKLDQERHEVQQQISLLQDLQATSHNLATSQILLNRDKAELLQLAQQVKSRAEELELMTAVATADREEGVTARKRAEVLLKDMEKRASAVQERLETVEEKERLVKDQMRLVEDERLAMKDMKDRIVCSLCNSGLQSYPRLLDETPLLIWQLAGQQESALLAQEADFLNRLRISHKSFD